MQIPYLVRLTGAPNFPKADRIAAEIRFAEAMEQACEETGGVVATYCHAEGYVDAWTNEEAGPNPIEPDTAWTAAIRVADAAAWSGVSRPEGAQFYVRVSVPAKVFDLPDGVPF
jgi:hypothetical protein